MSMGIQQPGPAIMVLLLPWRRQCRNRAGAASTAASAATHYEDRHSNINPDFTPKLIPNSTQPCLSFVGVKIGGGLVVT